MFSIDCLEYMERNPVNISISLQNFTPVVFYVEFPPCTLIIMKVESVLGWAPKGETPKGGLEPIPAAIGREAGY